MAENTEIKRQLVDLEFLQTTLTNINIPTHLSPPPEIGPLPVLSLEVKTAEAAEAHYVQLMYIPSAEIMSDSNLLQIFTQLPQPKGDTSPQVIPESLLSFLNLRTPLGYFSKDEVGETFYRYIYTLPRFRVPDENVFLEVLDLYTNILTTFGNHLMAFRRGEVQEDEIRQKLA